MTIINQPWLKKIHWLTYKINTSFIGISHLPGYVLHLADVLCKHLI